MTKDQLVKFLKIKVKPYLSKSDKVSEKNKIENSNEKKVIMKPIPN